MRTIKKVMRMINSVCSLSLANSMAARRRNTIPFPLPTNPYALDRVVLKMTPLNHVT